jgi:hypothetical protein
MKLQAPPGTTSISHAGEPVTIEADGTCEVSNAAALHLCDSFGFTLAGKDKAAPKEKPIEDKFTGMSRPELIGYIKSKNLPFVPSTSDEAARAIARSQYSPEERKADEAAIEAAKAKA